MEIVCFIIFNLKVFGYKAPPPHPANRTTESSCWLTPNISFFLLFSTSWKTIGKKVTPIYSLCPIHIWWFLIKGSRPKKLILLADMSIKGGGTLFHYKNVRFSGGGKNALNFMKQKLYLTTWEKLLFIILLRPRGGGTREA